MTYEKMEDKIKQIIKELSYINEDGGIEIYTDYRDRELSEYTIKKIFNDEYPRSYFDDLLSEWTMDYDIEYGRDDLEHDIKEKLNEEEKEFFNKNYDMLQELIMESVYFYYNENDFNNYIDVNIMVDCGNWNYDCTCDNILNYYGRCCEGYIEKESSMLWLAKTQSKATALRKACKNQFKTDGNYVNRNIEEDKFIESCIQELENSSSHMATVTFLVKMQLFDLFKLIEMQREEYDENGKYDPRKNEKSKSYIVLDKKTECGLFNPWGGGGSVLEIELEKDVKLPIKYCVFTVDGCKRYGYDIGDVYGLSGDVWKETLKEVKKVDWR